MPRIHSIREVRFVKPFKNAEGKDDWRDERGYNVEIVTDPIVVEHYAEWFERGILKAKDQIHLCAKLGHKHDPGGCGGKSEFSDGKMRCEYSLACLERDRPSLEKTMLVRIDVPV